MLDKLTSDDKRLFTKGAVIGALVASLSALTIHSAYSIAKPFATSGSKAESYLDSTLEIQPIDPIVTGGTESSQALLADWESRHAERKRCNFCAGFQPYPGD